MCIAICTNSHHNLPLLWLFFNNKKFSNGDGSGGNGGGGDGKEGE